MLKRSKKRSCCSSLVVQTLIFLKSFTLNYKGENSCDPKFCGRVQENYQSLRTTKKGRELGF